MRHPFFCMVVWAAAGFAGVPTLIAQEIREVLVPVTAVEKASDAAPAGGIVEPAPTPVPLATPEAGEPGAVAAEPVSEADVVTRLQIYLDQQNFGPGKIDGRWGEFTGKALARYAKARGLEVDASIYEKLPLAELHPVYTTYTIRAEDQKWIGPTASKPEAQSKLKKMLYGSLLEFLEERFHVDKDFLRQLNPGLPMDDLVPGMTVRVPNVAPFRIEDVQAIARFPEKPEFASRKVLVSRRERMATLVEGEQILAAFPITPGTPRNPTPPGTWRIVGITSMPNFRWDEGVLNRGVRTDQFFLLPPGPNNPVGVIWIALSKPGIGMHGTNTPSTIGRAASHGCMRLANWDAVRLAQMVTRNNAVIIE